MTALWLLLALIVIMVLTGNFLEPLILGRSVNLSPTVAFLSIVSWGWLWGGIGMIVAVPATAVVKVACDRLPGLEAVGAIMGQLGHRKFLAGQPSETLKLKKRKPKKPPAR
jgi:predicted PurR-regulated permease PerM